MITAQDPALPMFTEHRVARDHGDIYVRDFRGAGPAFVLLHGFPDNALIYDDLIPHLAATGRRIVTIDFLGFGASDKPGNVHYNFAQQLGDVKAVVDALGLEKIIPVGHDAGGPAAINFALEHPEKTTAVTLINAFYGDAPGLRVPELIELFSNRKLTALSRHFLQSPQQFGWLLNFQRDLLMDGLSEAQAAHNRTFLGKIIDENFTQQPSAAPAFAQMTSHLSDQIAADTARLIEFRRLDIPVLLLWGKGDPYLHVSVAEHLRSQARTASVHIFNAGHWPQIDAAAEVARTMLENQ